MSDRHWQRSVLATSALALIGAAAVTGCGGGSASSTPPAGTPTGTSSVTPIPYTSVQLRSALLDKVNGEKPAAAAEAGDYGALPDVATSKSTMNGVKVTPSKCATASSTGFNSASFTHAPASVVTFRVGRDGVSEVLVSATPDLATSALADSLPTGCEHYSATVDGKTFNYSVRESSLSGIASQARALNVKAAGYAEVDVWSIVYRGAGFVGAITMVGPDASEAGVKQLALESFTHASQALAQP